MVREMDAVAQELAKAEILGGPHRRGVLVDGQLRPLFRWPGGKRWLIPSLLGLLPDFTGRYFEPFLGGAALFLGLQPADAFLTDSNPDLVNCYRAIRDTPGEVAACLQRLPLDEQSYYAVRSSVPSDPAARAARFIYLTSLAFNGIYRVNRNGEFNVPYGGRQYPWLRDPALLDPYTAALQRAELAPADFEEAVRSAGAGDLVYFDPPYTVAHSNNGFQRYNNRIFQWRDQVRLARVATTLAQTGCHVLISNAHHESIASLYPGFNRVEVSRSSTMAADAAKRNKTSEYILASFPLNEGRR
jgi:DNA adenine methylase